MNPAFERGADYERKIEQQADLVERIAMWRASVRPMRGAQAAILSAAHREVIVGPDYMQTSTVLTDTEREALCRLDQMVAQAADMHGLTLEPADPAQWSDEALTYRFPTTCTEG